MKEGAGWVSWAQAPQAMVRLLGLGCVRASGNKEVLGGPLSWWPGAPNQGAAQDAGARGDNLTLSWGTLALPTIWGFPSSLGLGFDPTRLQVGVSPRLLSPRDPGHGLSRGPASAPSRLKERAGPEAATPGALRLGKPSRPVFRSALKRAAACGDCRLRDGVLGARAGARLDFRVPWHRASTFPQTELPTPARR